MEPEKNEPCGCCASAEQTDAQPSEGCPGCGTQGRKVKPITIESLVDAEARKRLKRTDGFRFCSESTCTVAYFQPDCGCVVEKSDVIVRIGQKEAEAPRPVCYCFEHTVEDIQADIRATGTTMIADEITAKCREGLDRCEETNPQGSCCLGNVRRAIKDALEAPAAGIPDVADCCGNAESKEER